MLLALLLLWLPLEALAQEAPRLANLTAEQLQSLLEGRKIASARRNGDVNRGEVVGAIQAPMNELAVIVRDYANIPRWSDALVECRVMRDDGRVQYVEGETALPWPLTNRTWRIRSEAGNRTIGGVQAWVNQWTHEPGYGNINDTYGFWLLYPHPTDASFTIIRYVVNANPGLFLPNFVLNSATQRVLPQLLQGLESRHRALHR
jgi:hypothetical protein